MEIDPKYKTYYLLDKEKGTYPSSLAPSRGVASRLTKSPEHSGCT